MPLCANVRRQDADEIRNNRELLLAMVDQRSMGLIATIDAERTQHAASPDLPTAVDNVVPVAESALVRIHCRVRMQEGRRDRGNGAAATTQRQR
ncbi:hypothetical protein F6X40_41535 [Paraburkholderia sp. UCT31]|uniref:hypothetical protein n=1 Tax=Paraburkholderia sp. UCT31 TaxID=2615209 RepID=UPI0016564167|nr:hypothetical protein [Paraburkholderia sp. UCT31]MBC8742944.1 hypothetical protein [Paraburkholderia sp. UCT31]